MWSKLRKIIAKRRRHGEKNESSRDRRAQATLVYLVIAAVLLVGLQSLAVGQAPEIPYTTFKSYLQQDKVAAVEVGERFIRGRLTEKLAGGSEFFKTVRIQDEGLLEALQAHNVQASGAIEEQSWSSILYYWVLPIAAMVLFWSFVMRQMGRGPAGSILSFGKSRTKVVGEDDIDVTFDSVAGVDEAKEELSEIVQFLREPERYTRIGARIPKGVLLVGPPGTGKTLLSRAVAGEAKVPFFLMSGSDFVEMFVGVGAARVRDLFEQAKRKAPCIIFIDELDALGKARGVGVAAGHDEREQTLNQLLVEMDGFDPNVGVVIMAATNRPEVLDPALLRPGRFDRQILVDRPDRRGREAILRLHAAKVVMDDSVDLARVAERTPGFAGADLANTVNEAALLAVRRGKEAVSMADFDEAIERVVAGLEKKGRLISEKERRIVAYHEVGHAVVGQILPNAEDVQKVSIVPRGMAALGMTWQRPTEDRYLLTKSELEDRIAALLGGRAAEELFVGDITTGAQNDLSRATDLARAMVRQYGMSRELGPVSFDAERRSGLPVEQHMPSSSHGAAVADAIDAEVQRVLTSALDRARELLSRHRDAVERIAALLLEHEVIDGDRLNELLGPVSDDDTTKRRAA